MGLAALREIAGRVAPVGVAGERTLPVVPALAPLLVGGALRRGSVVSVVGSASLLLGVVAGPSGVGSWAAAVGMPWLGMAAAVEAGVDVARLALVPSPGSAWASVVAALVDALDVVAVRPPGGGRVRPVDARRLAARARERGAVLVVDGDGFGGADVRLSVASSSWSGLGRGHGVLRDRQIEVLVSGRGPSGRERRVVVTWPP